MIVDVRIVVWCESIRPGCTFTARISDGAHAKFYSGQGDTAFEAIAWCLDDYVRRALLGNAHAMARRADAKPGDFLGDFLEETRPSSRPRSITPAPIVTGPVAQPIDVGGCFEQRIPTSPAPRFFSLHSPTATSTPTTPRRARGGRR